MNSAKVVRNTISAGETKWGIVCEDTEPILVFNHKPISPGGGNCAPNIATTTPIATHSRSMLTRGGMSVDTTAIFTSRTVASPAEVSRTTNPPVARARMIAAFGAVFAAQQVEVTTIMRALILLHQPPSRVNSASPIAFVIVELAVMALAAAREELQMNQCISAKSAAPWVEKPNKIYFFHRLF